MWNDIDVTANEKMIAETVEYEGHGGKMIRSYLSRPVVEEPITMAQLIERLKETDLPLFCYENGTYPIKEALKKASSPAHDSAIVIGPEGGFDEDEAAAAEAAGVIPVSLGNRILRTESAAPFVLACLSLAFE